MSSSKSCPRVGGGVQRHGTGSQVWSSSIGVTTRLSKAKSSPNVSKPTPTIRSTVTRIDTSSPIVQAPPKRSPSVGGLARTSILTSKTSRILPPARNVSNVMILPVSSRDNDNPSISSTRSSASIGKIVGSTSRTTTNASSTKTDPKRRVKDGISMSCTILEDRALLKKGLVCTPEKLPRKPDVMRKKCLSRSTSLWNVPADTDPSCVTSGDSTTIGKRVYRQSTGSMEAKKDPRYEKNPGITKTNLNRTTSLWNVPSDGSSCGRMSRAKSVSGLRPSKIPLLTQYSGGGSQINLGLSLADLSSVDRFAEKLRPRIIDFDEVDKAPSVSNIYENCREANESARRDSVGSKILESGPIYENLKESKRFASGVDMTSVENDTTRKDLARTTSSTLEIRTAFDLEKRAAELMAELDDDDDSTEETTAIEETRISSSSIRLNVDSRVDPRIPVNVTISKENGINSSVILERSRNIAKSQESLHSRREPEISIQEIRKNWEKQIRRCQTTESPEIKAKPVLTSRINSATVNLTKKVNSPNPEITLEARKSIVTSSVKRTKDIVHLVNFFNCKNTETPKETAVIPDTWPKIKDSSVTTIHDQSSIIKKHKDKDEKSNGYASDGNCSEDSGHMSNENDVEWKDDSHQELKSLQKSERFLKEIIHDLDSSLERTIEVFDATPIVQRFTADETKKRAPKSSISTSSGASSIDSWEESSKSNKRLTNVRRFEDNSTTETSPSVKIKTSPLEVNREQIFFRSGALERLESQRDEKLTGHIILLQARCRGYLARRKLNTLKLQDLAVRCIQRNVRKLMSVREWPWWRLYVKVAPLLNVHRTEDQLKARTEELEVLRAKVERLEQERNHLKHDNDKLEAKLSVMSADFAEEHSTSTLAAERIDAETSERLRLERELQDVTDANKNLQQTTERLEMELLYARAADLNGLTSDLEDGEDGGVYKQRYEHAIRELEFTKRKMAQQHEDDLEQLVGLKKQLEKKLADAYEEVEEQRQVVGQWKRRVQKLNGEMHDLRLLLEEQTARNNLLEKKQRKFDAETQNLMDDLRQEKAQRERLAREKEIAIAEKFTVEQNLSDARLEIELQEERLHTLGQELEELTFGGKTEEEVAQLKKAKHELEKKVKDQEEELDDLAGQVQLLEQAKLRLEMSIEQQRKEMRKEMQQRDEELEDCRGNAHKKVKALESQLENEHEERTILLREKHELERRLVAFEEQDRTDRAAEAETTQRLKRDLKRTRALLRDAQTMLERSKGDSTGKAALRQLKNQLEDAECARAVAVKAKQALEQELNETQAALEEASRSRSEAEERANTANRERTELVSQLEENEEELAEVLKKYRASVQQVSAEQAQLQESQVQIASLEAEKSSLKDQLSELSQRLESVEQLGDPTANSLATRRLEFRAKELESKLELEQTTRARLETQIARLKESVDKLQTETALLRTKEQTAQDAARRLQRSLREARDDSSATTAREQEATRARRDLEKALEAAEAETKVARDDLRLALQRIDDLQSAIQGELDLDCSEEATSENSDSD